MGYLTGELIRQSDLEYQQLGHYTDRTKAAYWNGRNDNGASVASGAYFYHLDAGDFSTLALFVLLVAACVQPVRYVG